MFSDKVIFLTRSQNWSFRTKDNQQPLGGKRLYNMHFAVSFGTYAWKLAARPEDVWVNEIEIRGPIKHTWNSLLKESRGTKRRSDGELLLGSPGLDSWQDDWEQPSFKELKTSCFGMLGRWLNRDVSINWKIGHTKESLWVLPLFNWECNFEVVLLLTNKKRYKSKIVGSRISCSITAAHPWTPAFF